MTQNVVTQTKKLCSTLLKKPFRSFFTAKQPVVPRKLARLQDINVYFALLSQPVNELIRKTAY